jgi:hypothetical protein
VRVPVVGFVVAELLSRRVYIRGHFCRELVAAVGAREVALALALRQLLLVLRVVVVVDVECGLGVVGAGVRAAGALRRAGDGAVRLRDRLLVVGLLGDELLELFRLDGDRERVVVGRLERGRRSWRRRARTTGGRRASS